MLNIFLWHQRKLRRIYLIIKNPDKAINLFIEGKSRPNGSNCIGITLSSETNIYEACVIEYDRACIQPTPFEFISSKVQNHINLVLMLLSILLIMNIILLVGNTQQYIR